MTQPAHVEKGSEPPVLQLGDGFQLRPLRDGDEGDWFAYLADPLVRQHTSFPDLQLETVGQMVRRQVAEHRDAASWRWALQTPHGRLVGTCGFSNWSLAHAHAELVYDLSRDYWGRGLMRRAVDAAVSWGFSDAGFNRVHAVVMATNERSIALLERCGFAREGLLREYRIARGEARDFLVYSLLRRQFRQRQSDA